MRAQDKTHVYIFSNSKYLEDQGFTDLVQV